MNRCLHFKVFIKDSAFILSWTCCYQNIRARGPISLRSTCEEHWSLSLTQLWMLPFDIIEKFVCPKVINLKLIFTSPTGGNELSFILVKCHTLPTHQRTVYCPYWTLLSNIMNDNIHIPTPSIANIIISWLESSTKHSVWVSMILCVICVWLYNKFVSFIIPKSNFFIITPCYKYLSVIAIISTCESWTWELSLYFFLFPSFRVELRKTSFCIDC